MNIYIFSCLALVVFSLFIQFLYVKKRKNLFAVDTFFVCCFSIFYSFDMIYSLMHFSEGGYQLSGLFFAWDQESIVKTAVIISVVPWIWVLGYKFVPFFVGSRMRHSDFLYGFGLVFNDKNLLKATALYILLAMVSITLVFNKLVSTVGLLSYFNDMAQRSIIFADFTLQNAYINFVLVAATPVATLATIKGGRYVKFFGWILLGLVFMSSLLSGARAPLVQMLFMMLVIRHFYYRKVEFNVKLILAVFIGAIILVQVALSTRTVSMKHDNIAANVFGTGQIPQSNNMHAVLSMGMLGELKGESIVNDLLSPIPSFFFSYLGYEKKMGGNTYYTLEFWPARWENTRSQISLGGVNELLYNYGIVVALLALFLISCLYSFVERVVCRNVYGPIFMTGLLWSIFQQLRGDYFHTVNKLFIFIVSYFVLLVLLKGLRFKSS